MEYDLNELNVKIMIYDNNDKKLKYILIMFY